MNAKKSVSLKTVAVLLTVVLLIGCAAGGTLAWLSANTDPVTNTFTVGDINITLSETTGENYKIVPGGKSEKDPKVTVQTGSEKCYVYVLVENTVKIGETVVATPNIDASEWETVATNGNQTLYRYHQIVDASAADVECPVFTEVSYSADITKANIDTLKGTKIIITAFAHQSDNTTQDVADAAAQAHFGLTNS